MSKYNVAWDPKSFTLTIEDGDAKSSKGNIVSQVVLGDVGDIPDSASHPQVDQHLRNIALQQGIDDYALVTVENKTSNTILDKYVQRANEDDRQRMPQRADMVVGANEPYSDDPQVDPNDPDDDGKGGLGDEIITKDDLDKDGKPAAKAPAKTDSKPAANSTAGGEQALADAKADAKK